MTATAAAFHVHATPHAAACPVCEKPASAVFLSRDEIAAELRARDRFFAARLDRNVSPGELRDLTDVVLGAPAAILRCMHCGVLIRDEVPGDEIFRDDRYDDAVMESLHETHVRAFREKEADYRTLLPPDARVVEAGSYAGGFLRAAGEWGWRAIGTDIGRDPVRFCRARGLDARCLALHECGLDAGSVDAVFVWNCFEQIAAPAELLDEARRLLRPAGLLVVRVPDADFYARQQTVTILAYNGLLGWPHRFGYDTSSLRRLVQRSGFAFVRALQRPAVRPLREAMHAWARAEEARLIDDANHGWIEVTFSREPS